VHVERVIGSIRRECLDHMIVLGEDHARRLLAEYLRHYNEARAHQALDCDTPLPQPRYFSTTGSVVSIPHLGALHHSYRRAA
jgi:transposase InsO family protein